MICDCGISWSYSLFFVEAIIWFYVPVFSSFDAMDWSVTQTNPWHQRKQIRDCGIPWVYSLVFEWHSSGLCSSIFFLWCHGLVYDTDQSVASTEADLSLWVSWSFSLVFKRHSSGFIVSSSFDAMDWSVTDQSMAPKEADL